MQDTAKKVERVRRENVPPALKVSEAIALIEKVNERAGGVANYDLFSQIAGNTKTSSSFQRKVSALRQYGVIEDRDNVVAISELGHRIVSPRNESDDSQAVKEAMLRIDLLNRIYERHRGRILPEDHFLNNVLLQEFKISRDFSSTWVEHFKDAATVAKLLFVRGDGKTQVLDQAALAGVSAISNSDPVSPPPLAEKPAMPDFSGALPIVLGPGKLALIKLPETWNSVRDLKRLLKMLELSLGDESDVEDQQ